MSDREDIERGRLIYTCNCGWIDKSHMRDSSTRPFVGAKNLWSQLNDNEPLARSYAMCVPLIGLPYSISAAATFPDGSAGYKVRYKQDMGGNLLGFKPRVGIDREYLVKFGLTTTQKKSVALAIFMEISRLFEDFQGSFPSNLVTDSGFSVEDLVSNLLGFYIAIGDYSEAKVLDLCHPVSKDTALKIWDRDGPVGDTKNKTFSPVFSQNTTNPNEVKDTGYSCSIDACEGQPQVFPKEFKSITPVRKGMHHIDFPLLKPDDCYRSGRSYKNPVFY